MSIQRFFSIFRLVRRDAKWTFALRRDAECVSASREEIECCCMGYNLRSHDRISGCVVKEKESTYAVVEDTNIICFPVPTDLEVWVLSNLTEQEFEDRIGFSFGHSNDAAGKSCMYSAFSIYGQWENNRDGKRLTCIHKYALETCCWVNSDEWMDGLDWFAAHVNAGCTGTFSLRE